MRDREEYFPLYGLQFGYCDPGGKPFDDFLDVLVKDDDGRPVSGPIKIEVIFLWSVILLCNGGVYGFVVSDCPAMDDLVDPDSVGIF